MKTGIWVEKYRPRTIADVIFQDTRQQRMFETFIERGDIPHLFLSGVQGTGKTTISKALVRDLGVDSADVLRINCSDEKIDAMRHKVVAFAMTLPMGKFKVVQLEEIDMLSLDAQGLLRGLIEDTSSNCRFIATCNYENKVIAPLKSRFQQFFFAAPDKEKIAERVVTILESEGVEYDAGDLVTYIDVGYPDIRKTIQLLQGNIADGRLMGPGSNTGAGTGWKFELLDALTARDLKRARRVVCTQASKEEHEDVYRFLYDNVHRLPVSDHEQAIVTIADHLYRHGIVADTEICLAACFISLSKL